MTIAIYSYSVYKLFTSEDEMGSGGAELQLRELGIGLRNMGYRVTYLVGDFGQCAIEEKGGFRFIKIHNNKSKHRFSRLFCLIRSLSVAEADMILERGASNMTFGFSIYSFFSRKKFIFCGASDINFIHSFRDAVFSNFLSKLLYRIGILLAWRIVVQKEYQQELLWKNYRRQGTVIPNFLFACDSKPRLESQYDVIWVSNLIPYKQPELVFKIARSIPEARFLMIGGSREQNYYSQIKSAAGEISNVLFLGFVPLADVFNYIGRSKIMINTTQVDRKFEEGFPNSFLQAWQMEVPVVSLISNPDHILDKYSSGLCSGTIERMIQDVNMLLEDDSLRRAMGLNGKKYILQNHNNEAILNAYNGLIKS